MGITEDDLDISEHAAEMMLEGGISVPEIVRVIQRGAKFKQNGKYLSVFAKIKVAHRIMLNGKVRIITVMWDYE
ncbi:MAG: DUF4258 domain-containing protein [Nanoarchaeota archaeon]